MTNQSKLGQYFTPAWAAELLVKRHFSHLNATDIVWEPSCGDGRFLAALPAEVGTIGTEIDPHFADQARKLTGRKVIAGDFRTVELPTKPTAVIGNPPYESDLIDALLNRCVDLLEYEQRVGLLLPVYYMQTASKVVQLNKHWSMSHELLPRNMFAGMTKPIMWANFIKQRKTVLSGFFLYPEVDALNGMHKDIRGLFVGNLSTPTCWRDAVEMALQACGGRATLSQIYACIEGNRPTNNPWWREKVRQIAGMHFTRVAAGEYELEAA